MSDEKKSEHDEEIQRLKRQAMVAERLRFDAIKNVRLKRDPLRLDLLALGVAHEFNNILGAAEGHAEWALESGAEADMKEALEIIQMACRRSSQVTRALQGLIQPKEEEKKIFKLKDLLCDIETLFNPILKKAQVTFENNLSSVLVYGNPSQMSEVFINLIKNSLDAFQDFDETNKVISIGNYERDEYIIVQVLDSGPGIPKVHHEMLFQPFFSTKGAISAASSGEAGNDKNAEKGSNSGLGLYLSKTIVQEHGGNMFLDSESPGACFILELPKLKNTP